MTAHRPKFSFNLFQHTLLFFFVLLMQLALWAQSLEIYGQTMPAPEYEKIFHRSSGWTGADGTYSFIQDKEIIWGFSDTFFGEVTKGARAKPYAFTHNSMVVQMGQDFCFPEESQAFSVPDSSGGWFWLFDGTKQGKILLGQFQGDGTNDFGFSQTGLWLASYRVVGKPPQTRVDKIERLPYFLKDESQLLTFGPAILESDDYTYLYGIHDLRGERLSVLARTPAKSLGTSGWEFFNGSGWSLDIKDCASLFSGAAMEASVYQTRAGGYVYLASEAGGIGSKVIVREAPRPQGPWGEPRTIFYAPENRGEVFCYNAKAHIDIRDDERLLVSYNVNTSNLTLVEKDASIYRPRFFWWIPPSLNLLAK